MDQSLTKLSTVNHLSRFTTPSVLDIQSSSSGQNNIISNNNM